ncbi:exported hypothetical protein [uncultured Gammaproteobacteria bacterium]
MKRIAAWALLVGLIAGPVMATEPGQTQAWRNQTWQVGQFFRDRIDLDGRQVPLPAGEWRLVGHGNSTKRAPDSEPFGATTNLVLMHASGRTVAALVVINTNLVEVSNGWDYGTECRRTDLAHTELEGRGMEGSCLTVNHVVTTSGQESARSWLGMLDIVEKDYLAIPGTWVAARLRAANRYDFIDVRYYFNPEARGLAPSVFLEWSRNDWQRDKLMENADRAAFVKLLTRWITAQRPQILAGLHRRMANPARPSPMPWDMARTETDLPTELAQRLQKLRGLRDRGVVSGEEFVHQSDQLAQSARGATTQPPWWKASLAKTLSWRLIASADTLAVSYLVTRNLSAAGSISMVEAVTKMAAYFGHEILWDEARARRSSEGGNAVILDSAGSDDGRHAEPWTASWQRAMSGLLAPQRGTTAAEPVATAEAGPSRIVPAWLPTLKP